MRTIGVVTTGRSDFGIYLPVLRKIRGEKGFLLHLIVGGMHLSKEFGFTKDWILKEGFCVGDEVKFSLGSDTPHGTAISMGQALISFAESYSKIKPDVLIVLGDRYEMCAAAIAALPFNIPLVHIHGGELTLGAIDNSIRHSITKMSHLHFVATPEYAKRVVQMGEDPSKVVISGAPSLDNLESILLKKSSDLEKKYGFQLSEAPFLVTFHPVTLEPDPEGRQIGELLAALSEFDAPMVFSIPNADTRHYAIRKQINEFVHSRKKCWLVDNLGTEDYFSLMSLARVMIGNSSSGLIETPSFELPVVNIGTRQGGRVRAQNVIDVDCDRRSVIFGIRNAIDPSFKEKLKGLNNPYQQGNASKIIVDTLKGVDWSDPMLVKKKFYDIPFLHS